MDFTYLMICVAVFYETGCYGSNRHFLQMIITLHTQLMSVMFINHVILLTLNCVVPSWPTFW
jgi:hypothetical protein